jgi:DNA topoisomerase-1
MFSTDPLESAQEAGLRYVRTEGPAIRRVRSGKSFRYLGPDGKPLRDPKHLERIRSLVIPPAWTNVWICPSATGHLQAVGFDARGRKQYRYHPKYRSTRDQAKFSRMVAFGAVLAKIRSRVKEDLALRGLPKPKVLAAVVRLLEKTYIRVGNDEYVKENDSFGLTTMRCRHVKIEGETMQFQFRGKSGLEHQIKLTDRQLAKIVRQCRELPGHDLFEYLNDDGEICRICSNDVNQYIRELSGQEFTAKDFRTWFGTLLAAQELHAAGPASSESAAKKAVVGAIKEVSKRLGNRPATCRKYYIHPAVLESYADGSLFPVMEQGQEQASVFGDLGLKPEEYAVLVIIAEYQQKLAKAA